MKLRNWLSGRTKRPATSAGRRSVHLPSISMPIRCVSLHLRARDLDGFRIALRIRFQELGPLVSRSADRVDAEVLHTLDDVGSFNACARSAPIFPMIPRGVPAGVKRPKVGAKSNPEMVSAIAGTSGASSERLSELIASSFTRPSFAWAARVGYPDSTIGTCPPTRAGTLCPVPL